MPPDRYPGPSFDLIVIALSARALAAAAHRSGYRVAAIDFWADQDLVRYCRVGCRYSGDWERGFGRARTLRLVEELSLAEAPHPIVYGAGFEDRPGILGALGARHRVLGNDAATVRRVKRPLALRDLCRGLDIAHPKIATQPPTGEGWLLKRAGGSGGAHVTARETARAGLGGYWQRRVAGEPVSALFLANGKDALVLGFSTQWSEGGGATPFRYAGAVRPAPDTGYQADMAEAVRRLAGRARLVGLNSADFLVGEDGFHLIEVNPRPGASLDVFVHPDLLRLHVEACAGALPARAPVFAARAAAARVVYAPRAMAVPPHFAWPDWCADLEARGRPLGAGAPLCTALAEADDAPAARRLVEQRAAALLDDMGVS